VRNKANCRYPSKTIGKLRLTLPPRLSRAIVSNKPNSPLTCRTEQSQSGKEVSGLKCEVSSSTAPAVTIPTNKANFRAGDPGIADCGVTAECVKQSQCQRVGRALSPVREGGYRQQSHYDKQSQLAISEQNHRQASLDAATRALASDSVEQTQFAGGWTTLTLCLERGYARFVDCAKQSQSGRARLPAWLAVRSTAAQSFLGSRTTCLMLLRR
jgi:hypothetical protein